MDDRRPSADDWRRAGQERYLSGLVWRLQRYAPAEGNDHDHCEFCWSKFRQSGDQPEGYATPGRHRWVCARCFEDFRHEFDWTLLP